MDWIQIEKDFKEWHEYRFGKIPSVEITMWFKLQFDLVKSELPPQHLNEEEKNVNVTADIKAVYERKT